MRDEILRKIGDRYGAVGAFIGTLYGSIADPTSLPWVVEGVVCGLIGCAVAGNAAELSAKYELPHQSYAKIQSIYHLARDEIVQYIRGK